jgi:hypothetical protein
MMANLAIFHKTIKIFFLGQERFTRNGLVISSAYTKWLNQAADRRVGE